MNKILDGINAFKETSTKITQAKVMSTWVMLCLLILCGIFINTSANSAKVYHCLQPNGTKAFQGRPCEKSKKTIAVTEQKNQLVPTEDEESEEKLDVLGKWTLQGISNSPDGELQTQKETISWAFFDNGQVTYKYEDSSAIYDYTHEGNIISMPDSPNKLFEIIKNEGNSAIWKTGTTYYFLKFSPVS